MIASLVDAARSGAGVINMSFGGGRLSDGEMRALRYALRKDVVLIAAAADAPIAEQGHPAKDLQPTGTGRDIEKGEGLVVTAADASGARASFAGRGSQISLAAMGDTGTRGGGIFSTFPAQRHPDRDRRLQPARPAVPDLPHDLQRRPALRLPGRHLDGGSAGGRRRGARARGEPAASARSAVVRLMKQTAQPHAAAGPPSSAGAS